MIKEPKSELIVIVHKLECSRKVAHNARGLCVRAGFENEFKIKNMGYSIRIPNGIISMVDVDFKCPKCECPHSEDDYYDRLYKSKHGLIYKQCKGCKTKLGITTDIRGDVRVWLKEDERKEDKLA